MTWLRRNRWFLVALVVLIPGAFVVSLIPRWFPYQGAQPQPDAVALGETATYSGAEITLTGLEVLDGGPLNAPANADVVVATIAFDVVDPRDGAYCEITVVSDEAGYERRWESETVSDSDYEIPDRFAQTCTFAERGAYDLQLTFLVPHGQVEDPAVQISSSAGLPRVLRLS